MAIAISANSQAVLVYSRNMSDCALTEMRRPVAAENSKSEETIRVWKTAPWAGRHARESFAVVTLGSGRSAGECPKSETAWRSRRDLNPRPRPHEYPAECAVFFAQFMRTLPSENLFANDSAASGRDMAPREAVIAYAQGAGLLVASGLHPNFPPVISRVRRLFRPSWGVSFVVVVSCSSQFFRPPFTL